VEGTGGNSGEPERHHWPVGCIERCGKRISESGGGQLHTELQGNDQIGSQWKYVPVRRLALFIEESLYRGTQWAVFEPNDEPLWSALRLNIGSFMQRLFRQGAFQGQTPQDAYFVKCDHETTPQSDINLGIVNVLVGFAPLLPAEFVVIQIQQMAGQTAS
jgi:phage tail sheath protein FI